MDLYFWNTDRLATGDADSRRRFVRIMGFGARNSPDIIGLSEVNKSALKNLERFSDDHSYRLIHRGRDDIASHAVLMISRSHRVHAKNVFTWTGRKGSLAGEVVVAAIEEPTGTIMTVASVYIHAQLPTVLGGVRSVQEFADRHSEGRVVAGGDFNIARYLDIDKELYQLGSPAFERISHEFGWTNVLPGPNETEVPTWPVGRTAENVPRQLDHVFTNGLDEFDAECAVVIPPEETVRLSDHALLQVRLDHRVRSSRHCIEGRQRLAEQAIPAHERHEIAAAPSTR